MSFPTGCITVCNLNLSVCANLAIVLFTASAKRCSNSG